MVTPADYSVQPHSLPCTHQWPESDDRSLFHSKLKSQTSAVRASFSEMRQCAIRINELQTGLDEDGQLSVQLFHTSFSRLSPSLPNCLSFFPSSLSPHCRAINFTAPTCGFRWTQSAHSTRHPSLRGVKHSPTPEENQLSS